MPCSSSQTEHIFICVPIDIWSLIGISVATCVPCVYIYEYTTTDTTVLKKGLYLRIRNKKIYIAYFVTAKYVPIYETDIYLFTYRMENPFCYMSWFGFTCYDVVSISILYLYLSLSLCVYVFYSYHFFVCVLTFLSHNNFCIFKSPVLHSGRKIMLVLPLYCFLFMLHSWIQIRRHRKFMFLQGNSQLHCLPH